jgi:putative tryptophan/tyrosine transport system substrate-binding protein
MHLRPILALIMTAGLGLAPASGGAAVAQQVAAPPALAQNGRGLFNEPPETRAMFSAVWGDRAPAEWIQEQDAVLSGGQAPTGPRIGFLYAGTPTQNPAFTQGLVSGLKSVGYTPGQDISIVWRFAEGRAELLPSLAAELVQAPVDLIVTPTTPDTAAATRATSTIPIVTMTHSDPVGSGVAASLEHPGGNVTGVTEQPLEFSGERLALLKEAVPNATRVAVLADGSTPNGPTLAGLRDAAAPLGLELQILELRGADELPTAFAAATEQSADAVMVLAGTLFGANRAQVARLAAEHRIPALYPNRQFVDDGGLMDYAFVGSGRGPRAAEYVFEILHGANPGDLAMGPPPEIELVLNLKAAQAIGHAVPPSVLARATEIIR